MSSTHTQNQSKGQNDLQASTSLTLASLLATIAAICISVLTATLVKVEAQITSLLFGVVGFVSIVTAALLVDWVLDDCYKIETLERVKYLNGGYFFFSLVMATIAFAVMVTTHLAVLGKHGFFCNFWLTYTAVAVSLFLKVMFRKDYNILLIILLGVSVWDWYLIISHMDFAKIIQNFK